MRKKYDLRELAKALELRKESAQAQAKVVAAELASKELDPALNQGSSSRCSLASRRQQQLLCGPV